MPRQASCLKATLIAPGRAAVARFDATLSPCRAIRSSPLAFDSAWFFLFGVMVLVAVARPVSQPRLTGLTLRLAAVGEILPAVERPDMGCIAVKVGPPDAELLFVRVDPSPQNVARHQPVGTRLALDTYDIS